LPQVSLFFDGTTAYDDFYIYYIPIQFLYYSGFFIIFDFVPNFYAELTGFADRQFYQDFWNATNFDEFARKWNRLVHEYLHRHFYLELLKRYKLTVF
jgi:sterol O-acyltransferase